MFGGIGLLFALAACSGVLFNTCEKAPSPGLVTNQLLPDDVGTCWGDEVD
jgi:hypothetical protein